MTQLAPKVIYALEIFLVYQAIKILMRLTQIKRIIALFFLSLDSFERISLRVVALIGR